MNATGTCTITGDEPGPLILAYDSDGCTNVGGCRANSGQITSRRSGVIAPGRSDPVS